MYCRWLGYLLLVALATFVPRLASACSCPDTPDDLRQAVTKAHAWASVVFVGRLVSSNDHADAPLDKWGEERGRTGRFEFEVIEVYKGKISAGQRVRIRTFMGEPCGFGYGDKPHTWLIYAHSYGGWLRDGGCSRSTSVERGQRDIPILVELREAEGAPPRIAFARCTLGDDEHGLGTMLILAGLLAARSRRRRLA
jgi:hypothetical protein